MKAMILKTALLTLLLAATSVIPLSARDGGTLREGEVVIRDMEVRNTGPVFTISYDVVFGAGVRSCRVELQLSTDDGASFEPVHDSGNLSGDVGKLNTAGSKTITYDVTEIRSRLVDRPVSFRVTVTGKDVVKRDMLVQAVASVYPQQAYGLMFGMVRTVGWYVRAVSDFSFPSSSYECSSDGTCPGGYIWTDGRTVKSRMSVTGGALFRAAKWLYPYVGAGYGSRCVYWGDTDGNLAKVSDYSTSGVAVDAGLIFKFGKFSLSLGATNTMFKYTEAQVGVGVMF